MIILSLFFIPYTIFRNQPYVYVDFACAPEPYNYSTIDNVQIALSIFPREAISGGGCIREESVGNYIQLELPEIGPTRVILRDKEEWIPVDIFVQGENIIINNDLLAPNESYNRTYLYQSINLWEMYTIDISIDNKGRVSKEGNILFMYGYISESWIISPIGIIILLTGILLLVRIYIIEKRNKK